jgi:hypothetical protein
MDGEIEHNGIVKYLSPRHAQVWFLRRSRDTWKGRHRRLKVDHKRLANQVTAVSASREMWRDRTKSANKRVAELAAENWALKQELQALKKPGHDC